MKTLLTFLLTVSSAFAVEQTDVVVVAATPSGIAAAVSAARSGSSVILLEEKSHVGGVVSAGLTNTDIYKKLIRNSFLRTHGGRGRISIVR